MGGDGLLGALAGELRDTDGALAVLPGGRGNDFARKLGLGSRPRGGLRRPGRSGASRRIDVADINGRAYLGIASSGLDSDAGDLANATRSAPSSASSSTSTPRCAPCARWRPARWEVVLDGEPRSFTGYSVAVCNSGVFGGGMFLAPERQARRRHAGRRDDRRHPQAQVPRLAAQGVHGRARPRAGRRASCRRREVAFHADRPFNVQADGDPIADLPATVRVQPGALRVMVP